MKKEEAFTLIELLVTVSIVSILATLSIQNFNEYRIIVYNLSSQTDLGNMHLAQEAYFVDNSEYTGDVVSLPGFQITPGVTVFLELNAGIANITWNAGAAHAKGNKSYCEFNNGDSNSFNFTMNDVDACAGGVFP